MPAVIAVVVLAGMVVLWPRGENRGDLSALGYTDQMVRAEVASVTERSCSYDTTQDCVVVEFTLLEGPTPGTPDVKEYGIVPGTPDFEAGQKVVLGYIPEAEAANQYAFADFDRRPVLWLVSAVFALAVIGLGRVRGLAALGGLAASVAVLVWFIVPAILEGRDPVAVATVGAAAIAFFALYLAHGIRPLTHVALIGTFAALVLTVILSAVSVAAAGFTGFADEDSFIIAFAGTVDVRGLVLAGIVLGALGALDDVTVTQASAVWELRRADPTMDTARLFTAGLRVGRDHIASTVNTLLLAYAGASMPLLLRFALTNQPTGIVLNSEIIATEVVRTLVGSVGLVTAVPITTWLAARVASRTPPGMLDHG